MGYEGLQPEDPQEIGPYRLLGQLGSGGLGRVFLGLSTGGRPIAVKAIRPELADEPGFRDRLRAEVDAARQVSGLYTALVVDADTDGPEPWLATAYVPGPSLGEAVDEHGPMPVETVLTLAAGLAEGLGAVHAAGLMHRDLKPSNVLLSKDGPRVIDFGISRAAEAAVPTGEDAGIGSPGYMSPEQILGMDTGPASDIFSLGAVLTFAATGEGPFGSAPRSELLDRVVKLPPDLGSLPDALRPLIKACLAKDPRRRPTAEDLLDKVGAMQPEPGWIAESLFAGFIPGEDTHPFGDLAVPAADPDAEAAGQAGAPPPDLTEPGLAKRPGPGRRRHRRSLVPAYVSGGLVVASAVAVLALTKSGTPPAGEQAAAQAQPAASALVVGPASSASASIPVPSAKPTHKAKAKAVPSVYVTPADNQVITPSVLSATTPAPAKAKATATAKPTKGPVKSASPAPTKSATKSATPTPTPTPTVTTTTPTPTPTTPTPTPTVTTSAPSSAPATTSSAAAPSTSASASGSASAGA